MNTEWTTPRYHDPNWDRLDEDGLLVEMTRTKIRRDQITVEPRRGPWSLSYSDAPYALCIHNHTRGQSCPESCAVWGLDYEMPLEEAWSSYDYADEYEVV